MSFQIQANSLRRNRLFRNSFAASMIAILGCLSTHILTILGVTSAAMWLGTVEHALVVAAVGGVTLTLYAVFRHRRCRHTRVS